MSVELRPLGVGCNIGCDYCYQQPQRDAGNHARAYDLDAMKAAIEREGGPFTLFGGEPLLLPLADLEALWAWGLSRFGSNSVQTNGTLITDAHIALFQKYRVTVGISIDGPDALNDVRSAGTPARTRAATAATEHAIARLCRAGIPPSVIVTLHRGNASADRLPALLAWVRRLARLGVPGVRLHLLEVDDPAVRRAWALTDQENVDALAHFAAIEATLRPLRLDVFDEMRSLLRGEEAHASCVWRACDPYTTAAVQGVEGNGQRSNCGRTQKEGVDFVKADRPGFERYLALYRTPQADGGCRDCRFFLMCKGQCPGTALDGDWRNRTEHCAVWQALFAHLERQLLADGETPRSVDPRRTAVEADTIARWTRATPGDFTRVLWTSDRARAVWQPRIARIARAWPEIERRSVAAGVRDCALQQVAAAEWPALAAAVARLGLSASPVAAEALAPGSYATTSLPSGAGGVPTYRVAVGRAADVRRLRVAWQAGDEAALARLLGYPACCLELYRQVWVEARRSDPTWAMAGGAGDETGVIEVDGDRGANILLRWLGVRAVPHLPCRVDCDATVRLADRLLAVARDGGFREEAGWIEEMLAWPVEWSALHGIAEVVTPIAKVSTRTDATARRRVVRRRGTAYPLEGARGIRFPFRHTGRVAAAPGATPRPPSPWLHEDNGFPSAAAMRAAHRPILDAVRLHAAGPRPTVLDLGCGNGALLAALHDADPRVSPRGVDTSADRIVRARRLLPHVAGALQVGDIFDLDHPWARQAADITILMPGRLLEVAPMRAATLRGWLRARGGRLVVYAYHDWLERHGGLDRLCAAAGLALIAPHTAVVAS